MEYIICADGFRRPVAAVSSCCCCHLRDHPIIITWIKFDKLVNAVRRPQALWLDEGLEGQTFFCVCCHNTRHTFATWSAGANCVLCILSCSLTCARTFLSRSQIVLGTLATAVRRLDETHGEIEEKHTPSETVVVVVLSGWRRWKTKTVRALAVEKKVVVCCFFVWKVGGRLCKSLIVCDNIAWCVGSLGSLTIYELLIKQEANNVDYVYLYLR